MFLSILLISMGISSLLELLIHSFIPSYVVIYQIGLTATVIILSLYALRDLALGFRGAVIVAATIGVILGIWVPDI